MIKKLIRNYSYNNFFSVDDCTVEIANKRKIAIDKMRNSYYQVFHVPDVEFTNEYRVPYPFRDYVNDRIRVPTKKIEDHLDAFSSYGVNVFGTEFYEQCMESAMIRAKGEGFSLGHYTQVVEQNIRDLQNITHLKDVSFHMSGTEAVHAAVRTARFNTGKKYIVKFKDAYHGWIDIPNTVEIERADDIWTKTNVAGVLVNPLVALYNKGVSKTDAMLIGSATGERFDQDKFRKELMILREYCTKKQIPLIFDDVFLGFRIALGGTQEYFDVSADMVVLGKTVGGGFPIGCVIGRPKFMRRYDKDRPAMFLSSKGTFSAHPAIMLGMNEFFSRIPKDVYETADDVWNERVESLNTLLHNIPIFFDNLQSVFVTHYTAPSRYNWMFQYYLRNEGLTIGPYGSGRLIFPINLSDEKWKKIERKIINAALKFKADGWLYYNEKITNRDICVKMILENLNVMIGRSRPNIGI